MKHPTINLKSSALWLILLIITNLFFTFVVWLSSSENFKNLVLIILIFTVIVILIGSWFSRKRQERQMDMLFTFLENTDEDTEQALLSIVDKSWHSVIHFAAVKMGEQAQITKDTRLDLQNYQEFIEEWVHEMKTPLSLATLILDNYRKDMTSYVYKRMEHVRCTIDGDVTKILYFARLQSGHVDYRFEPITLNECVLKCIENFRVIAEEKHIELQKSLLPFVVISDKKVLAFMLSQLLGNAFKYASCENGAVSVSTIKEKYEDGDIHLIIGDNGEGVPPEDLPFIFDKGFTGNHPNQHSATGMGLYFVKKYANELGIHVKVLECNANNKGFKIELIFPEIIDKKIKEELT